MPPAGRDPIRLARTPLLSWYRRARRDLPWRNTRDPYAIWVSEIMLQQTQVSTVIPYYERFLERFPDAAALARADEEEVLAAWSGLGYYRRARALHGAARQIVEQHRGRMPSTHAGLLELPGIGRYTAGAISSIAYGQAQPILDGNVRRVLARLLALDGTALGPAREQRALWACAERLVAGPEPGDLNQALMELGALVCTPQAPACDECPVARRCAALETGDVEAFPARRPESPVTRVPVAVAWLTRAGRILLERPAEPNPLRGHWELPAVEVEEVEGRSPDRALREALESRHGLSVDVASDASARLNHGIMRRRLELGVHRCRMIRGRVAGRAELKWVLPGDLSRTAVSGATLKVARTMTEATLPPPGHRTTFA